MTQLSIIIPVYNEAHKIEQDMFVAERFLVSEGIDGEIIIVDDGSSDNTVEVAQKSGNDTHIPCFVERLDKNYGKGKAVRTGVLKSRGEFVLFVDSGLCIPFEQVKVGIDLIRSGRCGIAHGSRKIAGCHISRPQSIYRRTCGKLFHWFLMHDIHQMGNLTDTQCGFKVYDGDIARQLYADSVIDGFMFDVEIILLALSQGLTICEFPVDWTCDPDSRLKPAHDAINIFGDLVRLKRRFKECLRERR